MPMFPQALSPTCATGCSGMSSSSSSRTTCAAPPDVKHYQLALQLRRTLVTMDRDYLDDRRFPLAESGGVIVMNAPDERQLSRLLTRVDRMLFRRDDLDPALTPPLVGRKLQINSDWGRD